MSKRYADTILEAIFARTMTEYEVFTTDESEGDEDTLPFVAFDFKPTPELPEVNHCRVTRTSDDEYEMAFYQDCQGKQVIYVAQEQVFTYQLQQVFEENVRNTF